MKVYHVETQEDYDALMIELEEQGYKWRGGEKLTDFDEFSTHGKDTYVYEECCEISISNGDYFKKHYRNVPVIEYKAKGENMKIYHVKTQADYDALMIELEEKGYKWLSGDNPTYFNYWKQEKENSYVEISGKDITFGSIEWHKKEYPNTPIIEYKAKGENMAQEENILDWATDVYVAVESVARDIKFEMKKSTVEADLKEAKSSAKKLIEKIDDYLKSLKPKFEVRDYVTVDVNGRTIIAKIDALRENKKEAHGLWYDKTKVNVKQDYWFLTDGNKFRHATPEEIAEYETALTFHEHGRKPFEVKEGDLIRTPSEKIDLVYYPKNFSRVSFLKDGWKLIKTAEEVNKWLENK